jgi:glycosyltransferase involved in cell wall biosynthesis
VVRALRPDVVAAHDGHGAALALRHLDRPVVVHRRVDFVPSWAGFRRYRRAAGVIAVSDAVAAILRAGGVERVAVVEDGVDVDAFRGAAPDPALPASLGLRSPFALAVGALVPHKGHEWLVRAMPLLPDLPVVVLGEGPLRARLLRLARRLGVADRLRLPGIRADVAAWMATASVFVHPSVEEGLGQAVIEAGLAGAPLVTTTAGGLADLGLGRQVSPADPRALAEAIAASLRSPVRADPQVLATSFSVERMVRRTVTTYATWAR